MTRIWLDTVTLAEMEDPISILQGMVDEECQLVIANTIVDVKAFQEEECYDWLEAALFDKDIVIEIWATPDEMTAKPFLWSSCGVETPAANSFEEAIKDLPNKEGIMRVKALMDEYGIPKGEWEMGQWAPPEPLSEEAQQVLGLTSAATRTEVLDACKNADRMDLFNAYNVGYNKGLAKQHMCGAILNTDGSVTEI